MSEDRDHIADEILGRLKQSDRGNLKIYIGMIAGAGKSYRMLQEAQIMMRNEVNVKIGFIETHGRKETVALLEGLPVIPRREVFYKGKKLEEMDVNAIMILHPEWVIVDELAHSNIPGSKNEKRWQDVIDLLSAGINVITAVNIQHIESINEDVKLITGIDVRERVPDSFLQLADEVVNIDLTADELITRLKEGKIYDKSKVEQALKNFFQPEKILQLRELALREVATQVERKVDIEVTKTNFRHEHFLACISSNDETAKNIIRKTARLANYYHSKWYVLYVQTPAESTDNIPLDKQRHLINNFKMAIEMGAEVIQANNKDSKGGSDMKKGSNIAQSIIEIAIEKKITTICIGKPHLNLWKVILRTNIFNHLLKALSENDIDLVILS
jgi:two-component system sensor histidine kinase KdpD